MDKSVGTKEGQSEENARREFLAQCGRFAIVTPPAMTMLLSVTMKPMEAYASSVLGNPLDNNNNQGDNNNNQGKPKPPK
jgi:hypothetical protein